MSAITSANTAQAITKLVATRAFSPLVGNLTMAPLVNRDYEAEIASAGDVINVPIPPTMSANNIAEGGTVTPQTASLGNAQVQLTSHKEATFQIPDVTKVINNPNLLSLYMDPAVIALAEAIETDILSLYPLLTSNTAVGSGGSTLTEATVDSAERSLFDAKVPQGAQKYLILSSTAQSQVRQLARFSEAQTIGSGSAIVTGMVGRIKDFAVLRSQYVQKPSSTTYNIGFTRDTFALVMRRLPQPMPGTGAIAEYVEYGGYGFRVVMSYQPNTLAQQFTVDCLYGVGTLREKFGIQVLN